MEREYLITDQMENAPYALIKLYVNLREPEHLEPILRLNPPKNVIIFFHEQKAVFIPNVLNVGSNCNNKL